MADKFGAYITKLMTTVKDFKEEEFVRDLAIGELRRLSVNIDDFIRSNTISGKEQQQQEVEKELLQEEKKDVSNK